ncbi:hypothetical protein CR513_39913, partial [Mucuna pruriens]
MVEGTIRVYLTNFQEIAPPTNINLLVSYNKSVSLLARVRLKEAKRVDFHSQKREEKERELVRIDRLKKQLSESFAMKDMEATKQILGIRIIRDRQAKKLWLSQEHYVKRVLQRFHMENAKVVSTPLAAHFKLSSGHSPSNEVEKTNMSKVPYVFAVGSLMYAMNAVKWILGYLHGTSDLRLCFGGDKPTLVGYSDSDMAGDIDSRKSTSGYLIKFVGGAVAWQSKLQKCVALSTTESAINLGKNSTFHSRFKHIDVTYHLICDALDAKLLELAKVHTDDNGADMMAKVVPRGKSEACCEIVGLMITST